MFNVQRQRPGDRLRHRRLRASKARPQRKISEHNFSPGRKERCLGEKAQECAYFALPLKQRFLCLQTTVVSAAECYGIHENLVGTSPGPIPAPVRLPMLKFFPQLADIVTSLRP